ncbi:MAG TPA: terminase [Phycisphaerales bacterium]|nr:terminase [Phycisphaerales bacterium]
MTKLNAEILAQWSDPAWRLDHLYYIVDADGRQIPFRMNDDQRRLIAEDLHHRNVILKARQRGYTTVIDLFILDQCLFNPNLTAGIIAHRIEDVQRIFAAKIKFPYEHLPEALRRAVPAVKCDASQLVLGNGSNIRVGLSMRSDTIQLLHVSEHGKICARWPEKAQEIRTGTLPACHQNAVVFIESTAEGRMGDFYELCQRAQELTAEAKAGGRELNPLEFRFHFCPWFHEPTYALADAEAEHVRIADKDNDYFDDLERRLGVTLSPGQRAWYVQMRDGPGGLGDLMTREYPSTPEEAFRASVGGAYYAEQMARARDEGRIRRVAHDESLPVYTFWDLGMADSMAIWFAQVIGHDVRLIDYLEGSGKGLAWYVQQVKAKPYVYGGHYAPQDIRVRELGTGVSRYETALDLGLEFDVVVHHQVPDGIDAVRMLLPHCWFDADRCRRGVECLEAYRKAWNDKLERYDARPLHDWSSHAADAFRYLAVTYRHDRLSGAIQDTGPDAFEQWHVDDNEYDDLRHGLQEALR